MRILGVDFSGAKTDDKTWAASGVLEGGKLTLLDCRPVIRAELSELLMSLPAESVAALDFPFSVPRSFAHFWQPSATTMPDLWAAAAEMDLAQFVGLRDAFVNLHGEPKRVADAHFPECYSCLHKANPNMVPMTFYGMKMLGPLWQAGCAVPPLSPRPESKCLLLEAMPGAALKAMKLPYKGYKKGANAGQLRQRILDGLSVRSGVGIENLGAFRSRCLASDDALDAVVASVVAALWVRDTSMFWRPCDQVPGPDGSDSNAAAQLEGWLYAPVHLQSVNG